MAIPSYVRTIWENLTSPAINATNLNKIENGINDVTNETNAQSADIDNLQSPAYIPITPSPTPPVVHTEGALFYDETTHSISYYNDVSSMTLNVGQEVVARVYNNTGNTISNGQVVRGDSGAIGGVPTVNLAQADLLSTSVVAGVATHDIPDATEGFITVIGTLSGINTSAFLVGTRLYLSDTVAGGYDDSPPERASYIGQVLVSDVSNGKIIIRPKSLTELPSALGSMNGGHADSALTADTWYPVINYTGSTNVIMTTDETNGSITALISGKYKITASIAVIFDTIGNTQETFYVRIVGDGGTTSAAIPSFLPRDGTAASAYPTFFTELVGGEAYTMEVSCTDSLTGVTYPLASFAIETVHLNL